MGGGGRPTERVIETSTGVGFCQVLKGVGRGGSVSAEEPGGRIER